MPKSNPVKEKDGTPVQLLPLLQLPKGDLYLRFDIHFPKKLTNSQKKSLI